MSTKRLKHPDSRQALEVDASRVENYLAAGWQEAPTKTTADRASGKKGGTAPRTTTKKESTNGS